MGKKKRKKKSKKKTTIPPESNYTRNSIIILLVLAALVFVWWSITNYKYWRSYEQYPAQITRIYQIYRGHYNNMWKVEYQYIVDNKTYTGDEEFFNKADYGDLQVGDTINIEVSSTKTEVNRWNPRYNIKIF